MKVWKVGKVKKVCEVSPTELEFEFTDRISVFDKVIPSLIPRKGETLCRSSAYWFKRAGAMKIPTHFREVIPPNKMRVNRVQILRNPSSHDSNYLIPLEVISRYYAAGSLYDRIKAGTVDMNLHYGDSLPQPFIEVTTKLERVDRLLEEEEALAISGLLREEYDEIIETVLKIDEDMNREVRKRGLVHVDGKKEFAFDSERTLTVVDTYGTADEDRFWDAKAYEEGTCIELSKEFVRSYYRRTGYYEQLYSARAEKKREPDIPPLSEEMVERTSHLYCELYQKITGEDIHES